MTHQIDETRVAATMDVDQAPEVQVTDEADAEKPSSSKWPTKLIFFKMTKFSENPKTWP